MIYKLLLLHYTTHTGALAVNGSRYEPSGRTIQLINVVCNGKEQVLDQCDKRILTPREGAILTGVVNVAGVYCIPTVTVTPQPSYHITVTEASSAAETNYTLVLMYAIIATLLLILILVIARYV